MKGRWKKKRSLYNISGKIYLGEWKHNYDPLFNLNLELIKFICLIKFRGESI